jgi:hypothetical protein
MPSSWLATPTRYRVKTHSNFVLVMCRGVLEKLLGGVDVAINKPVEEMSDAELIAIATGAEEATTH